MHKNGAISVSVIKRLPRYYRFLADLKNAGVIRISSRELSSRMGLTASQIRQDLNCFGGFGQQGYGYNVEQLFKEIGLILGLDQTRKAILIGAGNLGRAIVTHMSFETRGFQLIGIFDKKESLAGQMVRGFPVRHIDGLDEFCRENLPEAAVLCIPRSEAAALADQLIKLGVKGFWNFSHYDLSVKYPDIPVENVHLGDSLMTLCYNVHRRIAEEEAETQKGRQ
ncbi:MAG: redox-sensing transcriptional repressor Rex [Clostridiales bacterium]|nr:redox-sensing transcriptional repressor Rex [Clostridiales bacterium]